MHTALAMFRSGVGCAGTSELPAALHNAACVLMHKHADDAAAGVWSQLAMVWLYTSRKLGCGVV
jgi:hypothetical protein